MSYFIYENWVAEGHKARIHLANCSYCRQGKGIHPKASSKNGQWHGPFMTYDRAYEVARATGGRVSNCKHCSPRRYEGVPQSVSKMTEETISRFSTLLNQLLDGQIIHFEEITPSSVPKDPGVYRIVDQITDPSRTVYVGETTNLSNRLYAHLMANRRASTLKKKLIDRGGMDHEDAVKEYLRSQCYAQYLVVSNRKDRILFEHFAIAVLSPEMND